MLPVDPTDPRPPATADPAIKAHQTPDQPLPPPPPPRKCSHHRRMQPTIWPIIYRSRRPIYRKPKWSWVAIRPIIPPCIRLTLASAIRSCGGTPIYRRSRDTPLKRPRICRLPPGNGIRKVCRQSTRQMLLTKRPEGKFLSNNQ